MRFVEADRQNRLQLPEPLRTHAQIDGEVQQVSLIAHNYWLALTRAELDEQRTLEDLEAFEKAAPDLLNPACRSAAEARGDDSGPDQQL
jgi:hypothetical protein